MTSKVSIYQFVTKRVDLQSKKWIQIYQKLLDIEMEIVPKVVCGDYKHYLRKSAFRKLDCLVLSDLQSFSGIS